MPATPPTADRHGADPRGAEPVSTKAPDLAGPAVISQFWGDLAFLHWRVDPALVEPHLPHGVRPDVFDGSSWVGLIPFELSRSAFGPLPPVPYFGRFAETNVRLYGVGPDGRRSVVFRTLEAAKLVPVLTARLGLGLPYTWADMSIVRGGGAITYDSRRRWPRATTGDPLPRTHVKIRPGSETVTGDPLADFLTARWGMHVGRARPDALLAQQPPGLGAPLRRAAGARRRVAGRDRVRGSGLTPARLGALFAGCDDEVRGAYRVAERNHSARPSAPRRAGDVAQSRRATAADPPGAPRADRRGPAGAA